MTACQQVQVGISGGDRLQLVGYTNTAAAVFPASSGIGYQLTNGGKEQGGTGSAGGIVYSNIGDWVLPNGSAALYEVRATLNSGTLTSGTTGTWLSLGTTRTWTVERSAVGSSSASLTIEVRLIGGSTVLATGNVNITADVI